MHSFPPKLAQTFADGLRTLYSPREVAAAASRAPGAKKQQFPDYRNDPVGYARNILGIETLTADQETILRHLLIHPRRVLVPSGHNTGKTHLAAVAISWWFDSFDPGAVFTIGPRHESLKDTIWGEVRRQRARAGLRDDFIGPSAPEMRTSTEHWARAFTANKDASLTGRHLPRMLFVIEEACGVDPIWWEVIMTMFDPSLHHSQLCIFNPTSTTSQAYQEDQAVDGKDGTPRWHRFRLSSLNHPNVIAELRGQPKPIPNAVSLSMVEGWIQEQCEPVDRPEERRATDIEWPPSGVTGKPGKWFRPGPVFQSRAMGQWPDTGTGVWSPALFEACIDRPCPAFQLHLLPEIGADMATGKGEDYHAIHCRWGAVSVRHESSNTMDPAHITARLRDAAAEMAALVNSQRPRGCQSIRAKEIPIKLDDDGTGNAVAAFLGQEGYHVQAIGAGTAATRPDLYPRMRDQLWFEVAERAKIGQVYLGRLDRSTLLRLKQQLLAPTWDLDPAGRRRVEPKEKTKEKIGRSPDDADSFNLSHHQAVDFRYDVIDPVEETRGAGWRGNGRQHGYFNHRR